nr:VPLPA-CTERM sorting domain-containing protein [Dechloromonas sp.]
MKKLLRLLVAMWLGIALEVVAGVYPVEFLLDGSGKLAGARNSLVEGNFYDVSFVDGTCASVFSGCDSPSDFQFQDSFYASAATQALFNHVLTGIYDSDPPRTVGCSFGLACLVTTPFSVSPNSDSLLWVIAMNGEDIRVADSIESSGNARRSLLDFTNEIAYVWAVWSPADRATVPEPASLGLVLGALAVLGAHARRQSQAKKG